jgi:ferric-dicitrate binding protein FerR (iron transport regulator)
MSAEPERGEGELEELLRRLPGEAPDPARRAGARRAFLAGNARSEPSRAPGPARTGGVMPHGAPADDPAFEAWLAARAPLAPPAAAPRRRARLAFLTEVAAAPPPLRARRSFRRAVWALAAAAILAVTFLLPEPERWRVLLDGRLVFDGTEYLPGDEARLAVALEHPGTLETSVARARFVLGDALTLELLPHAALGMPRLPVLDGVEPLELELARGEAYLRTGPTYPGNPIVVHAGLADVALHGTTVGVLVDDQGTCVCVAEGTARVTSTRLSAGFRDLGPRLTLFLYSDPAIDPKIEAFPAGDVGAEAAHTSDLVAFQREP